jgi:hypothetical protein
VTGDPRPHYAVLDEDALIAAADLVGRTGAQGFEIGFLHDDVPAAEAGWYCHAQYRGARVIAEGAGPVEAAEALARRLLEGGRCRCGRLVALSDDGAVAFGGRMTDGSTWPLEQAAAAGQCRWSRYGRRWVSACGAGSSPAEPQRPRPGKKRKKRRR